MCKGLPEAVTTSRLQAVSAACDVQSGLQSAIRLRLLQLCADFREGGCRHCPVLSTAQCSSERRKRVMDLGKNHDVPLSLSVYFHYSYAEIKPYYSMEKNQSRECNHLVF